LSDHRLELQRHAARVLAPDEHVLAAVRAMPVGLYGGSMGIYSGAVVGAVVRSVAVSQAVKRAALSRFPLAGRMVIAMSDRRILIWQTRSFVHGAIGRLLGQIPLSRLSTVEVETVAGRSRLIFVFRDARAVTIEADTRDDPQRFVEAYRRWIAPQPSSGPSTVLPA
jgi:hypothetical protein